MIVSEDRKAGYFNESHETESWAASMERRNSALVEIVNHAYANAPAMRRKFDAAGIKPGDIRSVADLEAVPITHKGELAELQQADPPFGGFLGVPRSELKRIYMSPGPIYEPEAFDSENDRWAQAFYAAGFRKGDIGQVTFSFHLVPAAFWFEDALHRIGCTAVPGGVGNTDLQVRMMRDLGVTGYIGTPSFLKTVADKAAGMGYDLKNDMHLQVGFVAGEMLSPALRGELETTFGMLIRQGYGTADVGCLGFECFQADGMHFPCNCIVEIVDPETGKPLGPGETGEIVVTVFDRAYPMIRFGTGDLSYYIDEPCACGRTSPRLVKILGRVDQAAKVKGMFIHPSDAAGVAAGFPEIKAYQVVVTRENHTDQMTFNVVLGEGIGASPELAAQIEAAIPARMRVRGRVVFIEKKDITDDGAVIVDRRVWE